MFLLLLFIIPVWRNCSCEGWCVSSWPFWKKLCLTDWGNTSVYNISCSSCSFSSSRPISYQIGFFSAIALVLRSKVILSWSAALIIAISFQKCAVTSGFFQLAKSSVEGKIPVPDQCWPSKRFSVSQFRKKQSHPRKSRKTRQRRRIPSGAGEPWALQPRLCPALLCRASCPLNTGHHPGTSVLFSLLEWRKNCNVTKVTWGLYLAIYFSSIEDNCMFKKWNICLYAIYKVDYYWW